MRATMQLRPPTTDAYIAPTARPTPHGSVRSMLPLGADSYAAPPPATPIQSWGRVARRTRAIRMGAWGCAVAPGWGQLYPPPEAIRGPFRSPPYHLRLGDDVAPGAPATSVTYPDILTSMDAVAVPALEPTDVWMTEVVPSAFGPGAPSSPTVRTFAAPGLAPAASAAPSFFASLPPLPGGLDWRWVLGVGGAVLLLVVLRRRR